MNIDVDLPPQINTNIYLSDDAKAAKERLKTFEGRSLHIQYSRPKKSKKKKQKENTTEDADDESSGDETSPSKNDEDQSGNLFKTIKMFSLSLLGTFRNVIFIKKR